MELLIEPGRTPRKYWRDLWRYRELSCFLAWRDILVRYEQRVIGIAWALASRWRLWPGWLLSTLALRSEREVSLSSVERRNDVNCLATNGQAHATVF